METEKGVLTCDEVCAILKACGEAKVATLKFRDLEVEFSTQAEIPAPVLAPWLDLSAPNLDRPPSPIPVAAMTDSQHEKQSKASIEQDEIALREEQIAELQITDPLAAEEMIRNGELEDTDERDEE